MNVNWNISGHNNILNYLENCVKKNSLHHAYLFFGPEHVGKATTAHFFSKMILCSAKSAENLPCGNCVNCIQFEKKLHPDFHEIYKGIDEKTKALKKNISIDQILKLQSSISRYSLYNNHTVIIIHDAEDLSDNAKNALLKTLEEPNDKTTIILIFKTLKNVLKTIISRCQLVKFYPLPDKKIYDLLMQSGYKKDEAENISKISYGIPGKAISFAKNKDDYNDYAIAVKFFINLIVQPLYKKIQLTKNIIDSREKDYIENIQKINDIFSLWMLILRDMILIKNNNLYLINNTFVKTELAEISNLAPAKHWRKIYENILDAKILLQNNVHPKIVLENFIINS